MSLIHSPHIIRNGLVLSLDASNKRSYDGVGTTWNDLLKQKHNATLLNGVSLDSSKPKSFLFDGVDDYVVVSEDEPFVVQKITVNVWIKPTLSGANSWQTVVGKVTGNSTSGWSLERRSSTSDYNWWIGDGIVSTSPWNTNFITCPIDWNIWQNITGVFNGSKLFLYKNGVLLAEEFSTMSQITTGILPLQIGKHGSASYYWKGNISHVSIYDKDLSFDEINQNFSALSPRYLS